ncbi:MAG: hypothetical protein ACPGQV_08060 [Alphaproteobacteria bacterium]
MNYENYASGQKDWADNLNRRAGTHVASERNETAYAALERMIALNGRHHLSF